MPVNNANFIKILEELKPYNATLVAVSKLKPVSDIQAMYDLGQRDFGENYVQELLEKQPLLPADIRWHFIGHLQSNKVKYIAPFVHLIQGVDSEKLFKDISKQAVKNQRTIACLLQIDISGEETKYGMDKNEIGSLLQSHRCGDYPNTEIIGMMGMAALDVNEAETARQFEELHQLFIQYPELSILSMGMSGDYKIALAHGSNMVRIGSMLFGFRL